jgi:hypothetical protein
VFLNLKTGSTPKKLVILSHKYYKAFWILRFMPTAYILYIVIIAREDIAPLGNNPFDYA